MKTGRKLTSVAYRRRFMAKCRHASSRRCTKFSAVRQGHDNARGRTNEEQETRRRLYEEAGQPPLHGPAVAGKIKGAPDDPDEAESCGGDVAQIDRTKP